MYKVSVIIPMYNSEKYINKCLESLLNQTYSNLEIIVVDDGSTDSSRTIVEKISKKNDKIKYYYKKNGGVSSARNFGLKKATGYFVGFVDSDDFVEKNMFEKMVECALNDKTDLVVCNYFDNDKKYLIDSVFDKKNTILNIIDGNEFKGFTPNKLYKMEIIIDNTIMFDEKISMCEDLLFNIEYCQFIKSSSYLKEKMYHYVVRNNSQSRSFNVGRLTVLDSYNKILSLKFILSNKLLYDRLINRKIRHIMSLYLSVINNKKMDKVSKYKYINKLKKEWIGNTFIKSNVYSMKEKVLYVIICLILKTR